MLRDKRGFTLLEIMVAGVLSLLLLTLLVQVVLPVMKASGRTTTRVELQSVGSLAMQKISHDLISVPGEGISGPFTLSDGSVVIGLHAKIGFSADGAAVWSEQMVLYRWNSGSETLQRSLWPQLPGGLSQTSPTRLTDTEIETALGQASTRVLAGKVVNFGMNAGSVPTLTLPVIIDLRLESENSAGELESVELREKVFLRVD